MRSATALAFFVMIAGPEVARAQANLPPASPVSCDPKTATLTRTTLYFGLDRPAGIVSEREWRSFLRSVVTPRFPQGFTVWDAYGQWRDAHGRIEREPARVLLIIHPDTEKVRTALAEIIDIYKHRFQQEAVLREVAPVCAAF